MTNNSNFILLSFAILQTGESVMSAKGNRTIGIVNGKEDYSTIKESFGDIISEINRLVAAGKVNVEGTNINIEFFLGGDYKFILMMLLLKGATSNYACAWCKLHKDERWKVDQHYSHFNQPEMSRSLEEMHAMSTKSKDNYCCQHPPLFNIDLNHVVPDELHLLLRVTDILTENLVLECIDWDKEEEIDLPRGSVHGFHLKRLIEVYHLMCEVYHLLAVYHLMCGKRGMLMGNRVANMTGPACWAQIRSVFWRNYLKRWLRRCSQRLLMELFQYGKVSKSYIQR